MPGYKGKEYYAPEPTEEVDTLDKRFFMGLTRTQTGLIAPPVIYFSMVLLAVIMALPAVYRKRPALLIYTLFLGSKVCMLKRNTYF